MKCPRIWIAIIPALLAATQVRAADLVLLPGSATLDGPNASQRFLAELRIADRFVGDASSKGAFATDDPTVAAVSADGTVTPLRDGQTTLTVIADGQAAHARITVRNFERKEPWSFRNHVLPVLTKTGCNSGACHGAAAGKNGFRLTLRGYGPEIDYNVLTRQAFG